MVKSNGEGVVLLITPLFFLFILSLPFVAVNLAKSQELYQTLDFSVLDKINPQAIVVIGGGSYTYAPEYGIENTVNSHTLIRLRYTAKLAKKLKLPVMVSGGSVFKQDQNTEASLMADVLSNEFDIPVQWLETQSRNTAENAVYSHQILDKEEIENILLVTHAIHMSRAVKQFERVGFKVIPAPTVFSAMPELNVFSFLPSAHALELSTMAIHEWLGKLWYGLRY